MRKFQLEPFTKYKFPQDRPHFVTHNQAIHSDRQSISRACEFLVESIQVMNDELARTTALFQVKNLHEGESDVSVSFACVVGIQIYERQMAICHTSNILRVRPLQKQAVEILVTKQESRALHPGTRQEYNRHKLAPGHSSRSVIAPGSLPCGHHPTLLHTNQK